MGPKVGLTYIGNEFIVGVPARDLSVEEAALYGKQISENEAVTGRKLYIKSGATIVVEDKKEGIENG